MDYLTFMNTMQAKITEQVESDVEVKIHHAVKNNGTERIGFIFVQQNVNISPAIYLEEFYEQYLQGECLNSLVKSLWEVYEKVRVKQPVSCQNILKFSRIKDKIVYKLIQYEANRTMLKGVPHERILDLAVVYYILLKDTTFGTATLMIKNENLKMWGVEQEEIVRLAKENTQRLLPAEIYKITEYMYVVTNRTKSFGASVMLYDGIWERIESEIGETCYVIPSSVHELLLIPESYGMNREQLETIVEEINRTGVEKEEILSDRVYHYDVETGRLEA